MEITITLDHGSLNAEFVGEEREELEENLIAFIEFLKENEDTFDGANFSIEQEDTDGEVGLSSDYWEEQQESSEKSTDSEELDSAVSYGSIPNRTGKNKEILKTYFDIDPEGEEPPYLKFDVEVLGESGNSRSEKQMRSSLILMTLWRECNGIEEVQSPDLKDAVRISGIDDSGLFNMYKFNDSEGDRYFRREGSGANTKISLTLPGEREGFDQIKQTIEKLECKQED